MSAIDSPEFAAASAVVTNVSMQQKGAEKLAEALASFPHKEITAMDLLDGMAIAGLLFTPDVNGTASKAYFDAIVVSHQEVS